MPLPSNVKPLFVDGNTTSHFQPTLAEKNADEKKLIWGRGPQRVITYPVVVPVTQSVEVLQDFPGHHWSRQKIRVVVTDFGYNRSRFRYNVITIGNYVNDEFVQMLALTVTQSPPVIIV